MEKTDLSASASPTVGPGVPSGEGAAGPHGLRENPRPCNGLSPRVLHPANPGGGSIWSPGEEGPQLVGSRSGLAVQVDSCAGWIWGRGREGWFRGTRQKASRVSTGPSRPGSALGWARLEEDPWCSLVLHMHSLGLRAHFNQTHAIHKSSVTPGC